MRSRGAGGEEAVCGGHRGRGVIEGRHGVCNYKLSVCGVRACVMPVGWWGVNVDMDECECVNAVVFGLVVS